MPYSLPPPVEPLVASVVEAAVVVAAVVVGASVVGASVVLALAELVPPVEPSEEVLPPPLLVEPAELESESESESVPPQR